MTAIIPFLRELAAEDSTIWLAFAFGFLIMIAIYGPKWLDVIMRNLRESKKVLNEDKRKNEKHEHDMLERRRKSRDRERKQQETAAKGRVK